MQVQVQVQVQVHARPGQTESQVDPSFQLAPTCDSVLPGLNSSYLYPSVKMGITEFNTGVGWTSITARGEEK